MDITFHKEEFTLKLDDGNYVNVHIFDINRISYSAYDIPNAPLYGILEIQHESGSVIEVPNDSNGFINLLDMFQKTFVGFESNKISMIRSETTILLWDKN